MNNFYKPLYKIGDLVSTCYIEEDRERIFKILEIIKFKHSDIIYGNYNYKIIALDGIPLLRGNIYSIK